MATNVMIVVRFVICIVSLSDESEATFGHFECHGRDDDDSAGRAVVKIENAHAHNSSKHEYDV